MVGFGFCGLSVWFIGLDTRFTLFGGLHGYGVGYLDIGVRCWGGLWLIGLLLEFVVCLGCCIWVLLLFVYGC